MFKKRHFIYSPCYDEQDKRWSCKFTATEQVIITIMSCSYIKHCVYFVGHTDWQPINSLFTGHTKNLVKESRKLYLLVLL